MTDDTSAASPSRLKTSGNGTITVSWPKTLTTASDTAFLLNSPPKEEVDPSEEETVFKEADTWGGFGGL